MSVYLRKFVGGWLLDATNTKHLNKSLGITLVSDHDHDWYTCLKSSNI